MDKYVLYINTDLEIENYWDAFIGLIINKIDTIRIDCWNEEVDLIKELREYDGEVDESFPNMTIFYFKADAVHMKKLVCEGIEEEKVKYFSLFLRKGEKSIFSAEHNGNAIIIYDLTGEECEEFKKFLPDKSNVHEYKQEY